MRPAILAAAVVATAVLSGCGQSRVEKRVVDGVEVVCTWRDPSIGPDRDLRCIPVGAEYVG